MVYVALPEVRPRLIIARIDARVSTWTNANEGADAKARESAIAMTSTSNDVTGLPDGISLHLTGTNIGTPATISFASRNDAITQVMGDFVAALNDITGYLREVASPLGGELGAGGGELGARGGGLGPGFGGNGSCPGHTHARRLMKTPFVCVSTGTCSSKSCRLQLSAQSKEIEREGVRTVSSVSSTPMLTPLLQ